MGVPIFSLVQLQDLNGSQLVTKLEREPGKRESRYAQLFSDLEESVASTDEASNKSAIEPIESRSELLDRVATLEERIESLTEQMEALSELLDDK